MIELLSGYSPSKDHDKLPKLNLLPNGELKCKRQNEVLVHQLQWQNLSKSKI